MGSQPLPATTRGLNFYELDDNLKAFLQRVAPDLLVRQGQRLHDLGAWVGNELDKQAEESDRFAPPKLVQDLSAPGKPGERKNRVVFNAQYEAAQMEIYRRGIIGLAFEGKKPEPHTLSFVMGYLLSHTDISTHCPVTMTGAVAYVVHKFASEDVKKKFLHQSTRMDGQAKTGGTWATEKHSGSDVAQTTTTAKQMPDGSFRLTGQKWFASNASSGLAVATARPEGAPAGGKGLGLYLVPSHTDENWTVPNTYEVTALKEKLGTRALATAELSLKDTYAIELVPPPHGLRVMMEALGYSRVHNAISAAGVTHRALLEAQSWMEHRETFGKKLIDRPMNQKKLIGMAVDWLAASALAFEAAHSFDASQNNNPEAKTWMRLVTAIAKHRTADMALNSAVTAVQMVGGNGITADWATERLARDAMVLPVWEGPEQIQALEIARVVLGPEKGADVLIKKLKALAATLPPDLKPERMSLNYQIGTLKTQLDDLTAHPESAEYVADDILHHAGNVLTYALLCHEAGWELTNLKNPIKLMAAQKFAEKTFHLRGTAQPDPVKLTEEFNALVRGIPPRPAPSAARSSPAP
ncbi:MAG: acyl-CoA dehydrogenase family protein [Micavibrio sp.]